MQSLGILEYEGVGRNKNRAAKRAARKEKRKNKPRLFKKITLAAPRNAFLLMVAANLFKMAEKLYDAMQRNEVALRTKWTKLGGDYNKLKGTVLKNKKVKKKIAAKGGNIGEADMYPGIDESEIGAAPLAAAAALAVPIIKALAEFLGKKKDTSVEVTDSGLIDTGEPTEEGFETVEGVNW
jgi:hypothetical protein